MVRLGRPADASLGFVAVYGQGHKAVGIFDFTVQEGGETAYYRCRTCDTLFVAHRVTVEGRIECHGEATERV
jgi:hypothetical protein